VRSPYTAQCASWISMRSLLLDSKEFRTRCLCTSEHTAAGGEDFHSRGLRTFAPANARSAALLSSITHPTSSDVQPAMAGSIVVISAKCSRSVAAPGAGPTALTDAQFEISLDGVPRTTAIGRTSLYWPRKNPNSVVRLKDCRPGKRSSSRSNNDMTLTMRPTGLGSGIDKTGQGPTWPVSVCRIKSRVA
jgi:hypothetical protein